MTSLWASSPLRTTPTNQTQQPVPTFDTTLKYAEVLLSWSSVKMPAAWLWPLVHSQNLGMWHYCEKVNEEHKTKESRNNRFFLQSV